MQAVTHEAAGVAAGLLYSAYIGADYQTATVITGITAAAAMLPDIDVPGSSISRKKGLKAIIFWLFSEHRGFWHSLIPWTLLSIVIRLYSPGPSYYASAFFLGSASHVFLDMLNPMGVPIFMPFSKKRRRLMYIGIGSGKEKILLALLLAANAWGFSLLQG